MHALIVLYGLCTVWSRWAINNFPQIWGEHTTNHCFSTHLTNFDQNILKKMRKTQQQVRSLQTWKIFLHGMRNFLSVCTKNWNFSSWWRVCELYADGTMHVSSPIQTYVQLVHEPYTNGLVCKCVPALMHAFKNYYIKCTVTGPITNWCNRSTQSAAGIKITAIWHDHLGRHW